MGLLETHKELTRFEVAISRPKITLQQFKDDPLRFVSHFDKLSFMKLGCSNPCGVMQAMYKQVNRKFRKQMEVLQDKELIERIKSTYIAEVIEWFDHEPF